MYDFETKKRQILDRVGILDLVSEHVALKQSGKRWVGLCLFHAEKTPSLTVSPDLSLFKCFGCGKGGDIFSFVQFRENVPFMEAMRMLADRAGVELGDVRGAGTGGPGRAELGKVNAWALRFFQSNLRDDSVGRAARTYLRDRHMDNAAIERFAIGLATAGTPSLAAAAARAGIDPLLLYGADLMRKSEQGRAYDTFRSRIMFPIRDATSRVVGFGGRTLVDDRAKYLNTRQNPLFDKGRVLFGIDVAREAITKTGRAVVVEGYTDCLAAHQAGFAETVATLGTALSEAQVDLLRRYGDEVVFLFDSDEAGEAAADRAISVALPRCVRVRLARIPDGKDPCEFLGRADASAFSDVLKAAVDALEFKWLRTLARFAGSESGAARREAMLDFLRVVAKACSTSAIDEIQRGQLVLQVANVLKMDGKEVHQLMTRLQRGGSSRSPAEAVESRSALGSAPFDGEHAAWINLLEVVLNEPGLLQTVEELPDMTRIVSERDRRIARVAFDLAETLGEFRLADVLARMRDDGDAHRVSELAERGAIRGNFDATFGLAVQRIRRASGDHEMELPKRKLLEVYDEDGGSEERKAHLASIHRVLSENPHPFSGRRLIRPVISAAQAEYNKNLESVSKVEQP